MSTESRIVKPDGKPFEIEVIDDVEERQLTLLTDVGGGPLVSIKTYADMREQIMAFVRTKLVEGVDYGVAHYGGGQDADNDKAALWKPGAEKICQYLRLVPVFMKDDETLSMIPEGARKVFAHVCYLIPYEKKREALQLILAKGNEYKHSIYQALSVSEGRGMAVLDEKYKMGGTISKPPNTLIKLTQKRALVDAVLRVAGISDIYTQDFGTDDVPGIMPEEPKKKRVEPKATVDELHTDKQKGGRFVVSGTDVKQLGYDLIQILKNEYLSTGIFTREECTAQKDRIIRNVNNEELLSSFPAMWKRMADAKKAGEG